MISKWFFTLKVIINRPSINPLGTDVIWTYIRRSEDVLGIFWTLVYIQFTSVSRGKWFLCQANLKNYWCMDSVKDIIIGEGVLPCPTLSIQWLHPWQYNLEERRISLMVLNLLYCICLIAGPIFLKNGNWAYLWINSQILYSLFLLFV